MLTSALIDVSVPNQIKVKVAAFMFAHFKLMWLCFDVAGQTLIIYNVYTLPIKHKTLILAYSFLHPSTHPEHKLKQ